MIVPRRTALILALTVAACTGGVKKGADGSIGATAKTDTDPVLGDPVLGARTCNAGPAEEWKATLLATRRCFGCTLCGVDLSGAGLSGASLGNSSLWGANLTGADLSNVDLWAGELTEANLTGANLTGAKLLHVLGADAILANATLARADLSASTFPRANLSGANLSDATLSSANLSGANLTGANLSNANLAGANLSSANLTSARLANANVIGATLSNANLDGALLDGARWTESSDCAMGSVGACKAVTLTRDQLCARAWSGYSGTWVYDSHNGHGSCANGDPDDCGDLRCTNTQWSDYCYAYNCPAGYTCTLGDKTLTGPITVNYCSCIAALDAPRPVTIPDGIPCANRVGTCQGGRCVR